MEIKMRCPSCNTDINDYMEKCEKCGFNIENITNKIDYVPRKSGWLIDDADIIEEKYTNMIFERLIEFNKKTNLEFYIVTVKNSKPVKPSEYVFYFLNHYEIGGKNHNGIVLLLSLEERILKCEVGYPLEYIITDDEANDILNESALPLLKEDEFGEALYLSACYFSDIIENTQLNIFKRIQNRIFS